MLSEQVKLVEAKDRTVEEVLAELPEWARKIVKIARQMDRRVYGSQGGVYNHHQSKINFEIGATEADLHFALGNAKLEWWRK